MDGKKNLPRRLRNASPEQIAEYRSHCGRKARNTSEQIRTWFRERMEREGKLAEFEARIEALYAEGKSLRQSTYAAMHEFGFKNGNNERNKHRNAVARGKMDRRRGLLSQAQKRYRRKVRNKSLLDEFNGLPDNAPNKVELAWVRSHPKMMQAMLARLEEEEDCKPEKITLDVNDIIGSSNGPCPSKSAFTMLAAWMKEPKEFQKQLIPEQRKASDQVAAVDDEATNNAAEDDFSEIEKMLRDATK